MTDIKMFTDPAYEPARELDPQRLKQVQDARIKIADGAHGENFGGNGPNDKMLCIMEATAYIIYGEQNITDSPPCTSEQIRGFMISINDSGLSDRKRAMLKAVIPDIINTAPTHWVEVGKKRPQRKLRMMKQDPHYAQAEIQRAAMIAEFCATIEDKTHLSWEEAVVDGKAITMKKVIEFIRELVAVAKFDKQNADNDNKEFNSAE
jgi:hypothetical protein